MAEGCLTGSFGSELLLIKGSELRLVRVSSDFVLWLADGSFESDLCNVGSFESDLYKVGSFESDLYKVGSFESDLWLVEGSFESDL